MYMLIRLYRAISNMSEVLVKNFVRPKPINSNRVGGSSRTADAIQGPAAEHSSTLSLIAEYSSGQR